MLNPKKSKPGDLSSNQSNVCPMYVLFSFRLNPIVDKPGLKTSLNNVIIIFNERTLQPN
jgi:hypothetical protein